jgi:DNA repair protein RecN (Recombination protein N)
LNSFGIIALSTKKPPESANMFSPMLRELHIKNFSIIDDVTVEFSDGFNVITGETGAGKSIIINALSLALGERAAGEFIRSGEKEALIEAFFDIPRKQFSRESLQMFEDSGIDIDDGLILKRIITSQGKNRAYINGSMANVQTLSEISKTIVDVHGQYEHQSLLSEENQLDLLDAYGGLLDDRKTFSEIHESLSSIRHLICDLAQKEKDRAQRIDILKHQINEIEAAALRTGEEEELKEELQFLANAVRLAELANASYDSLYSSDTSCLIALSSVLDNLRDISSIDSRAKDALKAAEDALPLLEETGYFLRDYKDILDFDPGRLDMVQERLELIKALGRKYGNSIRELLEYYDNAKIELEELHHSEEKQESLKTELEEIKSKLSKKAQTLSKKRKAVAKKIEKEVINQLSELSMPDTQFSINVTQESGDDTSDGFKATHYGIDNIVFMISPNIGETLKPLAKVASGGELSRVMLALKSILAKGDNIPVLVFDEIDSGIGGKTAENVAKKLKKLSAGHQVICITHLARIASYAGQHLKINKRVRKERTMVEIHNIDINERATEIARMLSRELSDVSVRHAREMLNKNRL